MKKWIELEDTYITDQPIIHVRRSMSGKRIPDPNRPPKVAFLIVNRCTRKKNGVITRRRDVEMLSVRNQTVELDALVTKFASREDVILISTGGLEMNDNLSESEEKELNRLLEKRGCPNLNQQEPGG